jgi:hypothetical protein
VGLCGRTGCGKHIKDGAGVFCTNFWSARGPYAPCEQCWCAECYKPIGNKPFQVKAIVDEDGIDQTRPGEEKRFLEARSGDHMMTPFQCDLCHFRNMMGRNPVKALWSDREILDYVRRANLDTFWSREVSTVAKNLSAARKMERKVADRLGLPSITPPMGPFLLKDDGGMAIAIAVLDRSLEPGKHDVHVQWETFRKVRSTATNIIQAGAGGLTSSVGAYERDRVWISNAATHSFCFSRFMTGVHNRVGEIRKPDRAFTIEEVHSIEKLLEREWKQATTIVAQKTISEMGVIFIVGTCTGVRGKELMLVDLVGTKKSLSNLDENAEGHFWLKILGRTKGNHLSGAEFSVPCVGVTDGTGLRPGKGYVAWRRCWKLEDIGVDHCCAGIQNCQSSWSLRMTFLR